MTVASKLSLAAHDNLEEARGFLEEFVRFIKRHIMKIVSDKGNPDTDTSRYYVHTDWNDVRHLAEEVLEGLPAER